MIWHRKFHLPIYPVSVLWMQFTVRANWYCISFTWLEWVSTTGQTGPFMCVAHVDLLKGPLYLAGLIFRSRIPPVFLTPCHRAHPFLSCSDIYLIVSFTQIINYSLLRWVEGRWEVGNMLLLFMSNFCFFSLWLELQVLFFYVILPNIFLSLTRLFGHSENSY